VDGAVPAVQPAAALTNGSFHVLKGEKTMNLGHYLDAAVERFRDKIYLSFYDQDITYGELQRRVHVLANAFAAIGLQKGDFIHVWVQNSPETLVCYLAALKIGAVAGPINGWWKGAEVEYLLNDSKGRALIVEDQYLPVFEGIRDKCPHLEKVILITRAKKDHPFIDYHEMTARADDAPVVCPATAADIAYIFYTSGTTGNPKGVLLSHRNVVVDANMINAALDTGLNKNFLCFLPLFHVNAMLTCTSALAMGHRIVLRKAFSAGEFWEVVETYKVNFWSAVPAVYQILLTDPSRQKYDLSSMEFGICGAAPLTEETMRRFEETFRIPIVEGYGLTEGTCVSTINPRTGVRKVGSIGLALPGQDVKIVDDQGRELPTGQAGEIVIKGDNVMMGYYNKPEETARTIVDGYLHTGDVGIKDEDGYIFIVDRKKDMIIRGGENIYPKEIDNLLATHPKIGEAATVGVPDKTMGEQVKVYVVASDDSLSEQEVIDFCAANLAAFKVPKIVEILRGDLPRNPVGKVLKKTLREWAVKGTPKANEGPQATVADIFATMEARQIPENLQGITANYSYRITGTGGGHWTVCVADGKATVKEGLVDPNVTTSCAAKDWIAITLGTLDGMTAFTSGKLKVEGDLGLLTKATRFFKKYVPPTADPGTEKQEELIVKKQTLSIDQQFATGPVMGKFLKGLKEKKILANKCPRCGRLQVPPREVCAECVVRCDEWVEVGPQGVLTIADITYYASPDPLTGESRQTPYISAHFLLDGCKGHETMWHELNPADIDKAKKGARVAPVWSNERVGAVTDITYFTVVEETKQR
jgi:long-chain acyl-CoA synthetase